ncbi:MAG: hypothetical protein KBS62_02900 [Oscillospiraceae bacterium]|nr:hypothetical protein [Candidatus Ruminococcus equi]
MKSKLIAGLLCAVMCVSLLPVNAFADGILPQNFSEMNKTDAELSGETGMIEEITEISEAPDEAGSCEEGTVALLMANMPEPVEYMDGSGGVPDCASYKVIDADTIKWTEGWYIADGEVTIPARVEVSGNVNLILIDGCALTIKGGIHVPEAASLTIYAQSTENAGTLTATDVEWSTAAIGGNPKNNSGKITINGGNIHTECGMGIGHGYDGGRRTLGEVVINGGNIDSKGINGNSGSSVWITAPAGYAMAVRTGDDRRVEGSPFTSATNINDVLKGGWVHIRQVPLTTYNITVETNGTGTVTATPTSTVKEDAVALTAVPDKYYHFLEWQSDDVTVSKNNTFVMPDKDVTVKAIFEHDPDISYMDENGKTTYLPAEDVTIFTPDMKTLSNKWYLIEGSYTLEDRLQIKGDVNIILADGCSLTATKGINVGQGNGYRYNLTIYAQSTENPGTLTATNTENNAWEAAIGGCDGESSGQITINGGVIRATTTRLYYGPAAIGGGNSCGRGYVTINNGDVTAESWYGAAIGGSDTKDDALGELPEGRGYVTINGGTVKATNHMSGAAIGGGQKTGAEVTINGGVITAIGEANAVAIGGAYDKRGFYGKITITGGIINTKTEKGEPFLIGSGGSFKANPPKGYAIDARTTNNTEIEGSPFLSGDLYDKLKYWHELYLTVGPYHSITYTVQGNGRLEKIKHTIALKGTRVTFFEFPEEHSHFVSCTSNEVQFEDHGALKVFIMPEKDVSVTVTFEQDQITYLDAAGNEQTTKDYTVLKENTIKLEDGWYAVWNTVNIPERVETSGDVHLILMDGCNLETPCGIHVGPESSLTIYAQGTGTKAGNLTADLKKTGSTKIWQCSAIGGNDQENSGQITVNGGNITVSTDDGASGIGGGSNGTGNVTINNGDVTATARYGAGIGGGSNGTGNVTINNGVVTATTRYGAGIGGGMQGSANITINGGTVKGKGDGDGSGIGGGKNGRGNILITGGLIDGVSESGEGIMTGTNGKVTVSPQEGIGLEVRINDVAIEGSPFMEKKDIEDKLKGQRNVHIEMVYQSQSGQYRIISGANTAWTKGSKEGLVFVSNAEFDLFDSVKIDGKTISSDYYSAKEGSTSIMLKPSFLETLNTGTHSIEIVSKDGSAETSFTIKSQTSPNSPESGNGKSPATGDNNHVFLWMLLFAAGLMFVISLVHTRKKKNF